MEYQEAIIALCKVTAKELQDVQQLSGLVIPLPSLPLSVAAEVHEELKEIPYSAEMGGNYHESTEVSQGTYTHILDIRVLCHHLCTL